MTSATAPTTKLDAATLTAIRQAISAAQAGRLADACATAELALAAGGDEVALNAMLGMLRGQAGDSKAAIRHLEVAHRANSADVRIAANLAAALTADGNFQRAVEVATADLALSDPTRQLARIRGYAAQMAGDPAAAVAAYELAVAAAPNDWETWNNLGNARVATGDLAGGIAALRRSAELNPESAPTRLNLARALRRSGEFAEAERLLRAMASHFTDDIMSLIDLSDLLKDQGRPDEEVMDVLRMAVERDPDNLALQLASARQLVLLLEMERAEEAYRLALKQDPANAEAYIGLIIVYEHSRPEELDELVAEAERAGIDPAPLNLLRAIAHRRAKRYSEGLAALTLVPVDMEAARRADLLGQFHEGLGNYDEAFAAFTRMNEIHAGAASKPLDRGAEVRRQLCEHLELTTPEWIESWKARPIDPEREAPIFLVGFPRSGTTLLDTMLMGHPGLAVMEERPALSRIATELGGYENLADLNEEQVRGAQRRYFELAEEYVALRDDRILVDKSPLLMNVVPVVHRLFPKARFILALRHPADAVLSCFVSNFRLNPSMSNFIRLDTAAEFYDLTFQCWEQARGLLPIEVHTIVYENLVDNPEGELKRLAEALGLDWQKEMLDHRRTAATRGVITTASYAQVTEPIYSRSVGRWENYRKHLEPVLPVLAPWAEKFGYRT